MIALLLATLALAEPAQGPPPPPEPTLMGPVPALPPDELRSAATGARRTERRGMAVLGSWAVANLAVGTVGQALSDAPRNRAFHQGNALWNTVNLGLAAGNLLSNRHPAEPPDHAAVLQRADTLDRALLFNAGLDVGYIMAGLALQQAGARREDPRLQGFGDALILQGGFLFTFDVGLFLAHRRWTRKLLGR